MSSVITITGNLCADPEFNEASNGATYAKVRIASSEYGREPIFWSCQAWDQRTKVFEKAKKGSLMVITGTLRPWKDENENSRQPTIRVEFANYVGGGKKRDDADGGGLPF